MAENVIAAGSENRPPMLEKGMYEIWDRVKEPMEGMKMTKQE
ncbi:hypothetical protein Tco_0258363, partial [Tanacetum coccineum]